MDELLALQELDGQIRELQQEIRDIPQRKEIERNRLKETHDRLEAARGEMRAVQSRIAQLELNAGTARDKVIKLRQQQMTLKTNREFRAMEIEIDAAQREADAIEGDQIRAMDDLPLAKERVGACEARHNQEKGTADGYVAELEERHVKASGALQELENRRTGLAKGVNPQHLRVYDRVRTSRWPVIVKLDGGVCGGCHLTQPPAVSHLLRRNAALVTCQMCGRMLYC